MLVQLIRFDRDALLPGDGRWTMGRSSTAYSTLSWIASPWGKINFWRPHRLSRWRWLMVNVVVIDVRAQRRAYFRLVSNP